MSTHGLTILFLLALTLGVFLGYEFTYASEVVVAALILCIVQISILLVAKRKMHARSVFVLATIVVSLAVCIGIIRVQLGQEKPSIICEKSCSVQGKIIRTPKIGDTYQLFVLYVDDEHLFVQARVPLYPKHEEGESIEMIGIIREPTAMFPHGDKKGFDYVSYLENNGIGSESLFPHVVVKSTTTSTLSLSHLKNSVVNRLTHLISYPANTLSVGMLFGESSMPKELKDSFRSTGVSHIVVLSGFNIALVISFVFFILRWMPLVLQVFISIVSVCAFVAMVGGEASIIRATIMAAISLFAMVIGRKYVAKQALLLSLIAITLYDPKLLLSDVSLHLSFIATAGIIYLSEPIAILLKRFRIPDMLRTILETTLAAYVATLPYQMYIFGTVSPYAIIANVLIVPLVPLAMLLSFLTLCVSLFGNWVGLFFGGFTALFIDGMIAIIRAISSLPQSLLPISMSLPVTLCMYVVLVTLAQYVTYKSHETPLDPSGITKDETIYRY